jgi:flagellum-specific peptidoglycan hydrolase FlgJ
MASQLQLAWLQSMVAPAQIAQRKWGVPASVTLAQAILESAWGQSQLARRCNNFFGIKALPGEAYEEFTTREVVTGRSVNELARFAKYPSAIESFDAHGRLLATLPRYVPAMKLRHAPYAFGWALGGSGYSTEPNYGSRLGDLIEQFDLEQYDTPPQPDEPAAAKEAA